MLISMFIGLRLPSGVSKSGTKGRRRGLSANQSVIEASGNRNWPFSSDPSCCFNFNMRLVDDANKAASMKESIIPVTGSLPQEWKNGHLYRWGHAPAPARAADVVRLLTTSIKVCRPKHDCWRIPAFCPKSASASDPPSFKTPQKERPDLLLQTTASPQLTQWEQLSFLLFLKLFLVADTQVWKTLARSCSAPFGC